MLSSKSSKRLSRRWVKEIGGGVNAAHIHESSRLSLYKTGRLQCQGPLFIPKALTPYPSSTVCLSIAHTCTPVSVLFPRKNSSSSSKKKRLKWMSIWRYTKGSAFWPGDPPIRQFASKAAPRHLQTSIKHHRPPSMIRRERMRDGESGEEKVTLDDVQRIEALFGKAAVVKKETSVDDAFWDAIGKAKGNSRTCCRFSLTTSPSSGSARTMTLFAWIHLHLLPLTVNMWTKRTSLFSIILPCNSFATMWRSTWFTQTLYHHRPRHLKSLPGNALNS